MIQSEVVQLLVMVQFVQRCEGRLCYVNTVKGRQNSSNSFIKDSQITLHSLHLDLAKHLPVAAAGGLLYFDNSEPRVVKKKS